MYAGGKYRTGNGELVVSWCRACGQPQGSQEGLCAGCGADLAIGAPAESPIGLVYETRGKLGLGHKQGICLDVDGGSVLLHFSAKDKEPTRLPMSTGSTTLVPSEYCVATRLLYAAGLPETKQAAWDRDIVRTRAAALCGDIRVLRRVADEALHLSWGPVFAWAPLQASEKAWRSACHAASVGDERLLRESLAGLPATGYPTRVELLLPHLGAVHRNSAAWRPILDSMCEAGVPGADAIMRTALGSWDEALDAGAALLAQGRRDAWSQLRGQLAIGGSVPSPTAPHTPAWGAVSLISLSDRSVDDSLGQLAGLEPALLDDLVDKGRLTRSAPVVNLGGAARVYLLARLDPDKLSEDELRSIGHTPELARRLFLSRDRASLSGLPPMPRVTRYQALLDVIEGGQPDPERLDPATVALLGVPASVLAEIKEGVTRSLPPEVVADPSLWPIFTEQAITGKLPADAARAPNDTLNIWIGLLRLMGLLWEGRLPEAIEHGKILTPHLNDAERQQDEVLSMTAFALDQMNRVDEALGMLEHALQGLYTQDLLVNASIVASRARPEVGVTYLARLVEEAPTAELQRAGLDRAIEVWLGSSLDFPPVLVPALRTGLSVQQSVEDFVRLAKVAVNVAPGVLQSLPDPGGELSGPRRIFVAKSRIGPGSQFTLRDLADEYIAVYQSVGRPEWFNKEWDSWMSTVRESLFVGFGDAPASAQFVDAVLVNAPELLNQEQRFVLAPQAGAHLSGLFAEDGSHLNDVAWTKFFFRPIDDFLRERAQLDAGTAEFVAENFTRTVAFSALKLLVVGRDIVATSYNPLGDRLRWDQENRYAIRAQMESILVDALNGPVATLEQLVERLRRLGVTDKGLREVTDDLTKDLNEWRDEIARLRRNL
ncbi:MAG: hypothetical protein ACT4P1_11435 [Sporichthyaceae bacterium]